MAQKLTAGDKRAQKQMGTRTHQAKNVFTVLHYTQHKTTRMQYDYTSMFFFIDWIDHSESAVDNGIDLVL